LAQTRSQIRIYFEGAYGQPAINIWSEKYKNILLISGGIGITPLQSICNELILQFVTGRKFDKIHFVWSCADRAQVANLDTLESELPVSLPKSFQPNMLVSQAEEEDGAVLQTEF